MEGLAPKQSLAFGLKLIGGLIAFSHSRLDVKDSRSGFHLGLDGFQNGELEQGRKVSFKIQKKLSYG